MTAVGQVDSTATSNRDAVIGQFISEPLAAQTISGTVKGQIRAQENALSANLRSQCIIRVVQSDNTTIRGTLYAGDLTTLTGNPTPEWATTATNRPLPFGGSVALSSLAIQNGDRLVIEVGYRKHAAASTTGTLYFGDNSATDLAEDTTTTTANNPWIEFSQDLLPASTLLDTFTDTDGTLLQDHTPSGGGQWIRNPNSTGDALITGDRVRGYPGFQQALYAHSWVPASATYAVQAAFYVRSSTLGTDGLFARMDPQGLTWYVARYVTDRWRIELLNNGAYTLLVNQAVAFPVTVGQTYLVRFDVSDAAKVLYVDGSEVARTTNNAVTAAGSAGIRIYSPHSGELNGFHLDDFTVYGPGTIPASATTTADTLTISGQAVTGTGDTGAVDGTATTTKAAVTLSSKTVTSAAAVAAITTVAARSVSGKSLVGGAATTASTSVTGRLVSGKALTGVIHAPAATTRGMAGVTGQTATAGIGAGASTVTASPDLLGRSVTAIAVAIGSATTSKTTLGLSARAVSAVAHTRGMPSRKAMTIVPSALNAAAVATGAPAVRTHVASGKVVTAVAGTGVVGATSVATVTLSAKALTASASTVGLPTRSARIIAYRPLVGTAGSADVGTTLRRTMTVAGQSVTSGAQGVGATGPRVINVSGKNISGVAVAPTVAIGTTLPDVLTVSSKTLSALTTRPDGFGHYPFGHGPFGHAPDVGTSIGTTTRKSMSVVGRSMVGQANGRATPLRKSLVIVGSAALGRGTISQTGTTTRDTLAISGKPVVASVPTGSIGITARRVLTLSRKNVTAGVGASASTSAQALTLVTTSVNVRDRIYERKSLLVGV